MKSLIKLIRTFFAKPHRKKKRKCTWLDGTKSSNQRSRKASWVFKLPKEKNLKLLAELN